METGTTDTAPSVAPESATAKPLASGGLTDSLSDPLQGSLGSGDPLGTPPPGGPVATPEPFDAHGESHKVWSELVDGEMVTFVASKPMPVRTRLGKWRREASRLSDEVMKKYLLRLIVIASEKQTLMETAAAQEDPTQRATDVAKAQPALAGSLGVLFKAFDVVYPGIGASVVYRGLHFTKDWKAKRGRTVEQEGARSFDDIKSDGTFSTATYEIAGALAKGQPVKRRHLEAATRTVQAVLDTWRDTTDDNRQDDGRITRNRKGLENGIARYESEDNALKVAPLEDESEALKEKRDKRDTLQDKRDEYAERFTVFRTEYKSQFEAALSRFIDNQKLFEEELTTGEGAGYKDVPFTGIPFISTSKVAKASVEYAEGKLASDVQRSDTGTVGRILIYAAPSTALMEAGGIDVWAGLKAGSLSFTTYRKQENEITFAGSIPDEFLRGMTEVTAGAGTDGNTAAAEREASKRAAAFGGLIPLPLNED